MRFVFRFDGVVDAPSSWHKQLNDMQSIQGKVEKLIVGVEVSGSGDQVTSTHVATLMLSNKAVRMEMPNAFLIAEGDQIKIAGAMGRDGVFKAYAYRNLDNQSRGHAAGLGALLGGVIFSVVGLAAALCVLSALLGGFGYDITVRLGAAAFASAFMLGFGLAGVRMTRDYLYSREAKAAVA